MKYLLQKLSKYFPSLPLDPRTLLDCKRVNVSPSVIPPGHYHHFGIENGLKSIIPLCQFQEYAIKIALNIDGLPPFKSATDVFWPITAALTNVPHSVFIVGLYYGPKKPASSSDFLKDIVCEMSQLLKDGCKINDQEFRVHFEFCCCDMPAKSFVKSVISHSAFYGCDKCEVRGIDYCNRRVYLDSNAPLRTDESFRCRIQMEHHTGNSAFESLEEINMIHFFPMDYMHLLCKGVTIRLLENLRSGPLPFRLSSNVLEQIDKELLAIRKLIPSDFGRKPGMIKHLSLWKATQSRFFFMYLAPFILPKYCNGEFVKITSLLTVIMRILCDPTLCQTHNSYCKELVRIFLNSCTRLLGNQFLTMNPHCLLHLVDDCLLYGSVDNFSCFKFENFMRLLKKLIKSPFSPMQQLVNRISEQGQNIGQLQKFLKTQKDNKKKNHAQNDCTHITKFYHNHTWISSTAPNNFILTKDRNILRIYDITQSSDGRTLLFGHVLEHKSHAFSYPTLSSHLNIFEGQCFSRSTVCVSDRDLFCKMFNLGNVFIPILHSCYE